MLLVLWIASSSESSPRSDLGFALGRTSGYFLGLLAKTGAAGARLCRIFKRNDC